MHPRTNKVFYYNTRTRKARKRPPTWVDVTGPDGVVMYRNTKTGLQQSERPAKFVPIKRRDEDALSPSHHRAQLPASLNPDPAEAANRRASATDREAAGVMASVGAGALGLRGNGDVVLSAQPAPAGDDAAALQTARRGRVSLPPLERT